MEEIDAVDVCTPNRVHPPAVIAALRAGKHVLCEKPLAVTVAEILEMREALNQTDRILMTAQHHRFSPASVAIKAWVDSGRAGRGLPLAGERNAAQHAADECGVYRSPS